MAQEQSAGMRSLTRLTWNTKGLRSLFDKMQAGAMLLLHLFDGKNLAAKASELGQFLLNFQQPFLPLAVSDLGLCFILISKTKLFVQLLDVRDLRTETPYLFPKNIKMIHAI